MTTTTLDLLGWTVAHRMMRTDLVRLADLAGRIADGTAPCPDRRARELARWLTLLADEIEHHHAVEDEVAWPITAAAAGDRVDLAELTGDHRALDPMLAAVRKAADAVRTAPASRRAAAARPLAEALAGLRDHLVEHLDAEEASVFPVFERYVAADEWRRVERAAQRGGPPLGFQMLRASAVTNATEQARLMASVPAPVRPVFTVLRWVLVPRYRRRERVLFG
jgi:iron-sulfur cluster repair protein YtfE (RIC family)